MLVGIKRKNEHGRNQRGVLVCMIRRTPRFVEAKTLCPYATLFRSRVWFGDGVWGEGEVWVQAEFGEIGRAYV